MSEHFLAEILLSDSNFSYLQLKLLLSMQLFKSHDNYRLTVGTEIVIFRLLPGTESMHSNKPNIKGLAWYQMDDNESMIVLICWWKQQVSMLNALWN